MSVREPGVYVEFANVPVVQGFLSQQEGREICKDEPHVTIRIAGQDKETFFGPVTDEIKRRFPEEWEAFQKGAEVARIGTPLEHWPRLTMQPSLVRLLKNLAIFTVEDMASCTDAAIQKVGMGGQQLRVDAQAFLKAASVTADASKVAALEESNKSMADELQALKAQMAQLVAAKPRGRPPKEATE